jgi:biotin transport system substrate-specific component
MNRTLRYPTLADAALPRPSSRTTALVKDVLLVAAGTTLVSLCAQVRIPWHPVPFTGQTFAVLLVGGLLGLLRATAALALYFVIGALGAGVFQDSTGGWDVISGPTGGYIIGFILAAALVGYFAERGADRRLVPMIGVLLLGNAVIYVPGVAWLAHWTPPGATHDLGWSAAYDSGLTPFLLGDLIKLAAAAALLPAGWALLQHFRPREEGPKAGLV